MQMSAAALLSRIRDHPSAAWHLLQACSYPDNHDHFCVGCQQLSLIQEQVLLQQVKHQRFSLLKDSNWQDGARVGWVGIALISSVTVNCKFA